jgi:hypothetical protein
MHPPPIDIATSLTRHALPYRERGIYPPLYHLNCICCQLEWKFDCAFYVTDQTYQFPQIILIRHGYLAFVEEERTLKWARKRFEESLGFLEF